MNNLSRMLGDFCLNPKSIFNSVYNQQNIVKWREAFKNNSPYPHIQIDNLFSETLLEQLLVEVENMESLYILDKLVEGNSPRQYKKIGLNDQETLPVATQFFLNFLNSYLVLKLMQDISGIEALLPDPYLAGAGVHQTLAGGLLKTHLDRPTNPYTQLDRRLNILVYLNKDWSENNAGQLLLYKSPNEHPKVRITPVFNRTVIFETNECSFHGHPEPTKPNNGETRKSIAVYYYTNGRDEKVDRTKLAWYDSPLN